MANQVLTYVGAVYAVVSALALVVPRGSKFGKLLAVFGADLKGLLGQK